jgi:3-oxoacyl-[acyl-carrier-protein] synthase III
MTSIGSAPHQNVKTVSEAWIDRIGIPRARVVETRKEYGNVGRANVLLNLDRGATNGAFQHGVQPARFSDTVARC